ncbi:carbohydrate-binding protein [Streptomyces anulatus]|uniref:carbohydrate-binding protein n=1 Tax=Streptomyces anulatus TaxID=1892 RepID=UPI001C5E3C00|nr:carbohydrate-binding protein [Streptomyces anulatus]QYA95015.1 carbohydrate-binding protein [Streptomyces anulatus]WST86052.1 carbohydrate-binding protein [Streptomyces anulatus]WSU29813.1 carbohydrate-binding protein [Streptomyces anulatus]WSU91311.1 carbohydrate-binding protein [Streptomyces anulatus]
MTAGNNGASKPEDDDPFGYLYADGQAAGAQAPGQGGYGYPGPAAQPGVPRTSYNQVRAVGERQYGQQQVPQQQGGYGYPPQQNYGQQPTQQYNRQNPQYAAPETYPGGGSNGQPPAQGGHGGGPGRGGPNTKALLIAAVAVVAVVLIGIGAALITGDDDKGDKKDEASSSQGPAGEVEESKKPEKKPKETPKPVELPKQDAATLTLGGTAALDSTVKGAKGANGNYINLNEVGRSATWTVEVPEAGAYTLYVTYGVPGKDAKTTLTVNAQEPRSINMKNFAQAAEGDLEKGWTNTYAYVQLDKGSNSLKLSCETGDECDANLDQLELKSGHIKS